jgi:Zn-dependent M28 family amino/carboxypeptidase
MLQQSCTLVALGAVALAACGPAPEAVERSGPRIETARVRAHIEKLASDAFEGRSPGSRGEDLTIEYLTKELQALGLQPGGESGTFVQQVPLVGLRATPSCSIEIGSKVTPLAYPADCVLMTRKQVPDVSVQKSEMVFVGYGIVAPEYGWDDYKDVDVRGKTIVMLINDPPIPDAKDPSKLDESMFGGRAMTYYGRWTYKYEIAAEKGAAAALIVHETAAASYGFEVVQNSWGGENFDLASPTKGAERASVEGWIRQEAARDLCAQSGHDLAALQRAALTREFKPVPLGARASFEIKNEMRAVASRNVIAKLEGRDSKLREECIVYTSHWDHLGKDPAKGIFRGALDNASGVAAILDIARVFVKTEPKPARSVLFVFVTAEERGLLGSRWYAAHPLVPLERTLCNINIDGLNPWGRTADVVSIGYGRSTLDELLIELAAAQGRVVTADPTPEKGTFFRSDHFEFAKQGVPALYAASGRQVIGKPPGYGLEKRAQFDATDYHKPSDVPKADWDLAGVEADLELLVEVGRRVASSERGPEWKKGSEFQRKGAPKR